MPFMPNGYNLARGEYPHERTLMGGDQIGPHVPNINIPRGQNGPGGWQGLLQSGMLGDMGQGLLSVSGYSTMPTTMSQGLGLGMQNMRRTRRTRAQEEALKAQQNADDVRLRILQEKAAAEAKARAAAARAAESRAAAIPGLLAQVPEQHRPQIEAMMAVDPEAGMKAVQGLLAPQQEKMPSSVQEYQFAVNQGFGGSFQDWVRAKAEAGRTSINIGGNDKLGVRPLTEEEAAGLGLPSPQGLLVDSKGNVKEAPQSKTADMASLPALLDDLEAAGTTVEDSLNPLPVGTDRKRFDVLRRMAVAAVAKQLLGTPGAEPSPALYDQAEALVPDVGMLSSKASFQQALKTLRDQINQKMGKGAAPRVEERAKGYLK